MTAADITAAWDEPGRTNDLHPTRGISEDAYWQSGRKQAALLAEDIPAGGKVVDFGCGDGRVAIPLKDLGYQVTGADSSPRMLQALAVNDPDLPTVHTDGTDLYAKLGRKQDAVYALAVLIHHGYDDTARILEGLRAAVKKNGVLVLDWPVSEEPAEGVVWTDVTTWGRDQQDDLARELKLKRLDVERPWSVWRAV